MKPFRYLFSSELDLPDEVHRELVDLMYATLLPTAMIGVIAAAVGALIATMNSGILFPVLVVLCLAVTGARVVLILEYQRHRAGQALSPIEVRKWERRYAVGIYGFSALLGVLNACALITNDAQIAMLTTGMIFGYGCGLVARISVRPTICIVSMLLAVVPTVGGLAARFEFHGFHKAGYIGQAILLAAFAVASLETISHVFRTTLDLLLTKSDLDQMVQTDDLTGMANRISLRRHFDNDVEQISRGEGLIAVHTFDLDRFKAVNDGFGHPAGDALLQAVAGRLQGTLKEGDKAIRMGGDEFVILQTGIQHPDEARALAERVLGVLSTPYQLGDNEVKIGVSIGIAMLPKDGIILEGLLARADSALYRAKREGKSRVVFWEKRPFLVEGLLA